MPKHSRKSSPDRNKKFVPYTKGFKPPTVKEQKKAIGFTVKDQIPCEFEPVSKLFSAIPPCTSINDWLAQYKEDGQTYSNFLNECPWLSTRKVKYTRQTFNSNGKGLLEKYPNGKIYILQLGSFLGSCCPDVDALIEYTKIFLQLPVEKLPTVKLEIEDKKVYFCHPEDDASEKNLKRNKRKRLLDSRFHDKHYQIGVQSLLGTLSQYKPDDAICVIALTMSDLYEDKPDLFVAGMAAGNQRVAVFSLFRYDPYVFFSQEIWHHIFVKCRRGATDADQKNTLLQRGCRLLVHEICHLLGIAHCIYFACCMNGSGHLEEDFSQPMMLCPVDLRKLHTLVGFDVIDRYRQLKEFCEKYGFQEKDWFIQRINTLSSS